MIIIDYSGIAMAGIIAIQPQLIQKDKDEAMGLIRHVVLNSILQHKRKHTKKYGEVIIACDGPDYWRRDKFKQYKANRKKGREESELDWGMVFECMNTIREELNAFFPYKVIKLSGCEADDVIAVLTKRARTEFGMMEPVMIISSDNDMSQLQIYDGVEQWSPSTKKLIKKSVKEVKEYLNEAFVKGQKKDGIPSIYQGDNALVDGDRAKPIYAKTLEKFLLSGIDACENDEQRRNYERNVLMMDFNKIPEEIESLILTEYDKPKDKKFDRMELYNFLIKSKCRQLVEYVSDF